MLRCFESTFLLNKWVLGWLELIQSISNALRPLTRNRMLVSRMKSGFPHYLGSLFELSRSLSSMPSALERSWLECPIREFRSMGRTFRQSLDGSSSPWVHERKNGLRNHPTVQSRRTGPTTVIIRAETRTGGFTIAVPVSGQARTFWIADSPTSTGKISDSSKFS